MARTSKKDERLARLIDARYVAAGNARTSRETAWRNARQRYEPGYVDKTKVKRPPYIKHEYTFNTVNHKTAQLMAATEANGVRLIARSATPEHGNVGEVVTQALERQFRWKSSDCTHDNDDVVDRNCWAGNLYGNNAIFVRWYEDEDEWGTRFDLISNWDHFKDWKHGRWHIIRRYVTVAELQDIVEGNLSAPVREPIGVDAETGEIIYDERERDGGRAKRAFRKLLKQIRDGKRAGAQDSRWFGYKNEIQTNLGRINDDDFSGDDAEDSKEDPFNVRVELLHYYETHKRGICALMVPGYGKDAVPLVFQSEQNPYKVCPIADFMPFPVDDEQYGYGYGEIIGAIQDVLDYLFRAQVKLVAKKADAPLIARRSARIRRDFLASPTGKAIEVDDIQSALAYLEPGGDQGLYTFAIQVVKQAVDMATGMSEAKRGNAGGADSATEAAIAEAAGSVLDKMLFKRWRKHVEKIGQIVLAILKDHITEPQAIAYLGRDADQFLKLRPEYLQGTFEVEFGGSLLGMNPQQEVSALINFGQAFGQSGVVDMAALARMVATRIGIRNPDDVLLADQGRPKVSAKHEQIALFQYGQEIEVHPQDDHLQHVIQHEKALRAVAQETPMHPGIAVMREHMNLHLFALKQQMAMQAQGPPGPGGPRPMDASQAQGPGQPQALAPGVAGLNQQRQMSNEQANGGAPGGVVPNRMVGQMALGGPQR